MAPLIAGNWKMHGSLASAAALAGAVRAGWQARPGGAELLLCPAAIHLPVLAGVLAGSAIAWGGQDCHAAPQGAHTGDIAAPMLADCGARYVIIGHSERRAAHGEDDAMVRAKAIAAAAAGLRPILCVGEKEEERDAGQAEARVGAQLRAGLAEGFAGEIAYEPVWAIGSGRTPSEAEVAAMHRFIRATLRDVLGQAGAAPRILYGGSVKPGNAAALLGLGEVGGALIGGASLKAEEFLAIAAAAPG